MGYFQEIQAFMDTTLKNKIKKLTKVKHVLTKGLFPRNSSINGYYRQESRKSTKVKHVSTKASLNNKLYYMANQTSRANNQIQHAHWLKISPITSHTRPESYWTDFSLPLLLFVLIY